MSEHGYRFTILGGIALIFAVATGVWWVSAARPGLVFYLGAVFVGLLVWFDFQRGRAKPEPEVQADADETTLPGYHDGSMKG